MDRTMRKRVQSRESRGAFTLIEVITVVIIIAVLAALIAPRIIGRIGQSKGSVAKANAATLKGQVKLWMADTGQMPQDGQTLKEILWEKPSGDGAGAWKGPYVDSESNFIDPWGREFFLRVPGQKNIDFDVVSLGSDGKEGGVDEAADIVE